MKDFISLCSVVDKFYFSALEKSWDFICNDTKKGQCYVIFYIRTSLLCICLL